VGFAEQRDFRIDRPDGSVYLYGKAVNRRKVELEEARRSKRQRLRQTQRLPKPAQALPQGQQANTTTTSTRSTL
jgi:hypothetical protein